VIIQGEMTFVKEVKLFEKKILIEIFLLYCFFKMSVVVVLVDHPIRIHQIDKNPNENHPVQAHHHHHVAHPARMFHFFVSNKTKILYLDVIELHLFHQLNQNKLKLYLVYKFLLSYIISLV
jgi:hypothetical protein